MDAKDVVVQALPETSSDDRMHVLDDDCWCAPHRDGVYLVHDGATIDENARISREDLLDESRWIAVESKQSVI